MDLDTLANKIREKFEAYPKIEATVSFDFGADGTLLYDGTVEPATVTLNSPGEAKTTFRCTLDTFAGFVAGTSSPDLAYLTGKLKIEGSLGLAMKLKERLED